MVPKSKWNIIAWWEIRRFGFNLALVAATALSLWLLDIRPFDIEMGSGPYFVLLIFVGHLVAMNAIYTLGWIIALFIAPNRTFAPRFFLSVLGLSFFGLIVLTVSLMFLSGW